MSKHRWKSFNGMLFQRYFPVRGRHRKSNMDYKQTSVNTYQTLARLDNETRRLNGQAT